MIDSNTNIIHTRVMWKWKVFAKEFCGTVHRNVGLRLMNYRDIILVCITERFNAKINLQTHEDGVYN